MPTYESPRGLSWSVIIYRISSLNTQQTIYKTLPPIRKKMNIDIIGAGIGGLTTAIALEQKGIKTRIFEQAEQIKPVGAGIILANNAMQVYEKLGLRKVIEENGNPISSMNITKSKSKTTFQN